MRKKFWDLCFVAENVKNLQWPWEHEDGMRSSHRQCSWEGDICPGFPGEASPSPASSHIRDSWDTLAEQVTHQPGLCRELTPQDEGTKATSSQPEISGTNRLPGLLAVKSCLNRSISLQPRGGTQGERPKEPVPRTWLRTAWGLADRSLRGMRAGDDGRHHQSEAQ